MKRRRSTASKVLIAILLLVLPTGLAVYRASTAAYDVERLAPNAAYRVRMGIFFRTSSDTIRVRAYLPRNEPNLSLGARWTDTDLINSAEVYHGGNRRLEWWGETHGRGKVETSFTLVARSVAYEIDPGYTVPGPPDDQSRPFLEATNTIQVNAPEIASFARELAPEGSPSVEALSRIFSYCATLPEPSSADGRRLDGPEDALGTLHAQRGGAPGKARLFAALARQRGFPTRLVHGLLLDPGYGRDPTTWVEVRLGSTWVPFCPTSGLFARTDGRLLPFCRGDLPMIVCDSPVKTRIRFEVERTFAVRGRLIEESARGSSNWLGVWGALEESGVSVGVLCVVLMLPFGAFISVLLRNIVGLRTLGFFLPMLIAVGAMRAGLIWAIAGLLFVVGVVFLFRMLASPLRLLHFPRMAATLTLTVVAILAMAAAGALTGNLHLAHVTYLPIVVLTIATEHFSTTIDEEGPLEILKVIGMTVITIGFCYLVMNNYALQKFALAFPESFIVLIFLNILVGCWMGVRLTEHLRFRWLAPADEAVSLA
ncbi:MAG: 7TM domain-containing protein [Planctomycetota bacterium]|nr:7TM domain-containing protein [Planctomycetota bacterium]